MCLFCLFSRLDSTRLIDFGQLSGFWQDYRGCFQKMTAMSRYQNIASRMFAGHEVYDAEVKMCLEDDSEGCSDSLASALAGTCNVNFIILT